MAIRINWDDERERLLAVIQPRLAQMAYSAYQQAANKAGLSFNPNLANANAARWAREYSDQLLQQLGTTSAGGVGEIVARWIETPGATYAQLQKDLIHFGQVRAQTIAVTETTRAFAEGEQMAYTAEGIQEWTWRTNHDELVCFPAWTMISVDENKQVPIQNLRPGDKVLTRNGLRVVNGVSSRLYSGKLVEIKSSIGDCISTAGHPFFINGKWEKAENILTGDSVYSFRNKSGKISSLFHFFVGNTDNNPSKLSNIVGFAHIARFVTMPINSISFDNNFDGWNSEIGGVSANPEFLNKFNSDSLKSKANLFFKNSFRFGLSITGERAKTPGCRRRWSNSEFLPARVALDINWRASTFFRTVMPAVPGFAGLKYLPATFARKKPNISGPALPATKVIPVLHRNIYGKYLPAVWTNLINLLSGDRVFPALPAAKRHILFSPVRGIIKSLSAVLTSGHFPRPLAFLISKLQFAISGRHGIHPLTNLVILYHRLYAKKIMVYNIDVQEDHEYYANGLLVHNCHICGPLNGKTVTIGQPFTDGVTKPPAHPNCRCWTVAAVKPANKDKTGAQEVARIAVEAAPPPMPEPVASAFVPAKTLQDANRYAREKLGLSFADYKGIDIRSANEWNNGLQDNFDRFPGLKQQITGTGSTQARYSDKVNQAAQKIYEDMKDVLTKAGFSEERILDYAKSSARKYVRKTPGNAYAVSYPEGVYLNGNFMSTGKFDYEKATKQIQQDVKSGYHPEGTGSLKAIVDHEIGHQVDSLLDLSGNSNLNTYYRSLDKSEIEKGLSKYALKNKQEFIAEAWSEYLNNPNPRPIAQAIGDMIMDIHNRRYPK